jgi:hypothetical protein
MAGNGISNGNGRIQCEQYRGTKLVFAPPVKWYNLSLPYTSEMERVLAAAVNYEEDAVLVAPDRFTALMLKFEAFGKQIPVIHGETEARRLVDNQFSKHV